MEKTVSMDRDKEQLFLTLKNLTEQRDALLCKQECPGGWNKFGCKCYKTSDTYQSWNKSREFCVSHGADLVVVDSKEEMDFISKLYSTLGWYSWLGATEAAGEGMWRWVDGTALSLDNPSWSRGGPDGGEAKNCLVRFREQDQYKWADWSLMVLLGLLSVVMLARLIGLAVQHKKTASMERDIEQLLLTLKNLTEQRDALLCKQECPGGWKKFGCKCYKTSYTYQSWNKSRGFCVSHGADLVVVDSKEEMDFISRWYNGYFWLGATDAAGEGTWRWVDGTVLSLDDPFWSGGGPQGGGDKNCLGKVWDHDSHWLIFSCRKPHQFPI
uniref:C-type lectin domain-containing protein n=1 Tax=Gadus morhua TaxID=8049 RepID=A0A8C5FPV4_GADMO